MTTFETVRLVDFGDCDPAGIVFFPNFYRWIDGHFHQFTTSLGFDQKRLLDEFGLLGTPLRSNGCTFHSPARPGDRIDIASRLVKLGETSLSMRYHLSTEGRPVAEGHEVRVLCRQAGDRVEKAPIPPEIRAALEPCLSPE